MAVIKLTLASLLVTLAASVMAAPQQPTLVLLSESASVQARAAEAAALEVMYEFMHTFNERNVPEFAGTLAFPHVRVASGDVHITPDRQSMIDSMDFEAFAERFNWSHSRWARIETVQADADKVHFAVRFTRVNPEGVAYVTFDSLYIVQRTATGWGIRARSSFAP